MHLHRTLAYAVFFLALVQLVLVLTKARTDAKFARALDLVHRFGFLMAGRINLVLGLVLWQMSEHWTLGTWWIWVSLLLWGPIEAVSKRLVAPELSLVQDGGNASGRLLMGTAIELFCVVAIFGLMSARP